MIKRLLGIAAILGVAGFLFAGTANAACWWNGYAWTCVSYGQTYDPYYSQYYRYSPYDWYYSPYRSYDYYYDYGYRYPGY